MSSDTQQEESRTKKNAKAGDSATGTSGQGASAGAENALAATQENLDKVRDILFGEQAREQDRRYHDLDSKIESRLATLREESQRRMEAIEALAKREKAAGIEALNAESARRSEAVGALNVQVLEAIAAVERHVSSVDEQRSADHRAISEELLTRSRALRDEFAAQGTALKALVDKSINEFNYVKADRAALAALFRDLAERLGA